MPENDPAPNNDPAPKPEAPKLLTDKQVNALLAEQKREITEKFADYEALKAQAEGAKSVEQKLADLEKKHAEAEARALRSAIAAEYGISTKKGDKGEPSDADLFLTGSDEATLTAQASRLAAQVAERKKTGNVAPKEGAPKTEGKGDEDMRAFARNLFAGAD